LPVARMIPRVVGGALRITRQGTAGRRPGCRRRPRSRPRIYRSRSASVWRPLERPLSGTEPARGEWIADGLRLTGGATPLHRRMSDCRSVGSQRFAACARTRLALNRHRLLLILGGRRLPDAGHQVIAGPQQDDHQSTVDGRLHHVPGPPFLPFFHPPIELVSSRPRGRCHVDGWID
jgi:hypothetical protein